MPRARYKVLRPIHPNAGIRAAYRRKLEAIVDDMSASYEHWIRAQYRRAPPALAQDALPANELVREMSTLGKRWQQKIDEAAPKLGRWFAQKASRRSSLAMKKILADAGMTVNLEITPAMRDAYAAVVAENVGLIRSIGQQYHAQVQTLVMQSVQAGHDIGTLTRQLQERYGITKRRAALIATDQNNKATSTFVKVRQIDLGLKAKWLHSAGRKEPRPTHVANSGKIYDPAVGWFDPDPKVRRRIWPGELIRCGCVSVSVVKGFS